MIVYGAKISYFTGKFETYLRYKEIAYEYRSLDSRMYRWSSRSTLARRSSRASSSTTAAG